jgi:hypothetical protein
MSIKKRGRKQCNGDGLTSKVLPFYLNTDSRGDFISYCDLGFHRGIVLRPEVCESRRCNHYYKCYIDRSSQFVQKSAEQTNTRPPRRHYASG